MTMFQSLGDKFDSIFKKLRGQDKLTEANMKDALREVRLALLAADVNYTVVKNFVNAVQEKAIGQDVIKGVNPAQLLVKIVHDELVVMMQGGEENSVRPFILQPGKRNIILMLGLQGAGKTTFCGKLAKYLEKKGCRPLLVACDIYRPAAIDQLKSVGHGLNIPVFAADTSGGVLPIVEGAIRQADQSGRDVIIVDTAGRLHIDEVKMDELVGLRDRLKPDFTFLVADGMTGQDAVNSATTFNAQVGIDGVCLTKMDGDARGGAALSIRAVTGKPIMFVGTGEKADDLEPFHPDRVAKRILGMGDVISLVEKAQEAIDEKDAMAMQEKLMSGRFTWDDFINNMRMMRKMGPLKSLLGMLPGVGQMLKNVDSDLMEKEMKRVEVMYHSMTKEERTNGDLLSKQGSRRERVAKGSGLTLKQVTDTVRQFDQMKSMMASMGGMGGGMGGMMGGMNPFGGGFPGMGGGRAGLPGGMPGMPPPGVPMSKKMLRVQKEMLRQQERELAANQPRRGGKKDKKRRK
jgi:signal recognition particle subunit SRP54